MKAGLESVLHREWGRNGLFSRLMWPLSLVYGAIVSTRRANYERRSDRVHHDTVPVVVVGNLYVGGTGKTPVVIALTQALQQRGWTPGIISRGYGSRQGDKPRTGLGELDPALFGDEPALIAAATGAPICVHPDRPAALRRLRRQFPGVDVVISDDGLQHLALGRDLEIVVQDMRGIGNGKLLPAGPLREPAQRLESVDFIINNLLPTDTAPRVPSGMAHVVNMNMQPLEVEHLVTGERQSWKHWLSAHAQAPCAAAAAIGRPERFFGMLEQYGLPLQQTLALPDHHAYATSPFQEMKAECILITPKDAVKCRKLADARLYCVHPGPQFSDSTWLDLVDDMLSAISERKLASARAEALNSDF